MKASAAEGQTLEAPWRASGDDVAVVPGTSDYEPGDVRFSLEQAVRQKLVS